MFPPEMKFKCEKCSSCSLTIEPKGQRKVSLSTLNRFLNDVVCVVHLFLGESAVFHVMDTATQFSVRQVVSNTSMPLSICAVRAGWMLQFWAPRFVVFDRAFNNKQFRDYLNVHTISARKIPPRRHNKNALESKHRILRDIFLRLKNELEKTKHLVMTTMIQFKYGNHF